MKKIFLIITCALVAVSCNNRAEEKAEQERAKQATIDSMKIVMEKQKAIDSMKIVMEQQEAEQQAAATTNTSTTSTSTKKKGLSTPAKGALIGAGVGAVTGAVISKKKKGEGALIGAGVGAVVGAGTGAVIDESKEKK